MSEAPSPAQPGAPSGIPDGAPAYEACGVRLRSDLELPGLRQVDADEADVTVRRGSVEGPAGYPPSGIAAEPGARSDRLAWYGRARLQISDSEVVVDGDDDRFLRQCVVGPGLGVLLHRRGRLVLHGSAVDVGGRAVVLLGEKGAGKSTTAAALLARGHTLLTDDLVAVDAGGDGPRVLPGPTQMKLWPESADVLDLHVEPFIEGLPKGVWHGAHAADGPVPVGRVCALEWGDRLEVAPLAGAAAFGSVFGHAYPPRFLGAPAASVLVDPTAEFVRATRVARLVRPKTLDGLDRVVDALEDAVRSSGGAA